jgi:quercetin dioxygenase-like cupin family protein
VEVLSRAAFPDDITMTFRLKGDRGTDVIKADDPSDAIVTRIVQQPGAVTGWHTHPGPVIVTVAAGEVTIIDAETCTTRVYGTGEAFIDAGHDHVHWGENNTSGETVLYATFLDVPPGMGPTIPADDPGC